MLCAADMYLLPGLKRVCCAALIHMTTVDNVVWMVRAARLFSLPRLEANCSEFIANNIAEVRCAQISTYKLIFFKVTPKKRCAERHSFCMAGILTMITSVCFCFHGLSKEGITFWVLLTFFLWVSVSMPWLETCEHLLIFIFPILGFPYTVHTATKLTEIAICVQQNPS